MASLAKLAVKVTLQASTVQVQKVQGSSSATSGNRCSIRRLDQNPEYGDFADRGPRPTVIVGPTDLRNSGTGGGRTTSRSLSIPAIGDDGLGSLG